MTSKRLAQWLGELIVIVVGVLVALAVDDLVQYRADRELEAHLIERLAADLVADAGDLAIAQVQVARRRWLFEALTLALDGGGVPAAPPDSLVRMERHASLAEAAGRPEGAFARKWDDPLERPLLTLRGIPEFDLSDDAYREMLAAGALRTLRDPVLRSAIMAYYRTAQDMAANVTDLEPYRDRFVEGLLRAGTATTDPATFDDLVRLLRRDRNLAAQVREAQSLLSFQADFLDRVGEARLALEETMVPSRVR